MFTILPKSNLRPDHWHAMLISLLRGLAALQVAAAHLRAIVYPGFGHVASPPLAFKALAFGTGFAHLAVVVFFVLSGWLVGGSLLNKMHEDRAISNYAIDRATRLWIVLAPVLAMSVLLALGTGTLDPARADLGATGEYALGTYLGNLVGLQNIVVVQFGGNFALWSLSNETWYYVMFPLALVVFRGRSMLGRAVGVIAFAAIITLLSFDLVVYFALWLLGTAFSRIRIDTSALVRWFLFAVFVGSGVYFRVRGHVDDLNAASFNQDLIFSLAFALWLSSMQFQPRGFTRVFSVLNRVGQFFANFSFTLYVLHIPLILALAKVLEATIGGSLAPHKLSSYLVYAALYAVIVLTAWLVHLPFEANTVPLRNWIKGLFTTGAVRAGA